MTARAPGKRHHVRTTPDLHALTGPYVLNAVAADERAGFERHLATCADCAAEVNDLREAAARLSATVVARPPARLKATVTAAVDRARQLPPVLDPQVRVPLRVLRRSMVLAAAFVAVATSGAIAVDQYRDSAATTAISRSAATIL